MRMVAASPVVCGSSVSASCQAPKTNVPPFFGVSFEEPALDEDDAVDDDDDEDEVVAELPDDEPVLLLAAVVELLLELPQAASSAESAVADTPRAAARPIIARRVNLNTLRRSRT